MNELLAPAMSELLIPATVVITMKQRVRLFRLGENNIHLFNIQREIFPGSQIRVGGPEQKIYNHQTQLAVPCEYLTCHRYILFDEILDPRLREYICRLSRFAIAA